MTQHHHNAGWQFRGLQMALVLLMALLGSPSWHLSAEEPAIPGPKPLFDVNRPENNKATHLAMTLMGGSATPRMGAFAAGAVLLAGHNERIQAWSLTGPMSNLYTRRGIGATTLVLNGFSGLFASPAGPVALAQFATLLTGQHYNCWALRDTDKFIPFDRDWLAVIPDDKPVPLGAPETQAYLTVLVWSHYTSNKAFASVSRRDITFDHVIHNMDRYRGKVMHIEGRLKRINRFDPPDEMTRAGVSDLYEAWVFPEHLGGNPFCVRFTGWPVGLSRDLLGQSKIDLPIRVSFDGYLFKRLRYTANDGHNGQREAPLLIGHSPVLFRTGGEGGEGIAWSNALVLGIGAALGALILGAVGLTYWFRRVDNKIRKRILAAHSPEFVPPPPDAVPVAPTVAPSAQKPAQPIQRHTLPSRITFPTERGEGGSERGESDSKDKPPAGARTNPTLTSLVPGNDPGL